MSKKRVVVTGMGVVSCFGTNVDEYYDALLSGKSGIKAIEAFPCEDYPLRYAGEVKPFSTEGYIDKKLDRRIDPFIRYGIVAGKKALEMAGFANLESFENFDRTRFGAVMSSGMGGMQTFDEGVRVLMEKGYRKVSPFLVPYMITNMTGGLLAIDYGFMGPNYSISTACATANNSIIAAASNIRNGEADLMVCGGTEAPVLPIGVAGFISCKALSLGHDDNPTGASRPFDADRDGFVMGEGAGMLVLESYEHAKARGATILAEYLGGGLSCDAYHITAPRPEGVGMALAMRNALKDAGLSKESVDYINAHATSTPVGDVQELTAVHSVFGDHTKNMKINSTKSLIGHGLGASGGLESIAALQGMLRGKLHPTINLKNPDPALGDLDPIANVAVDCEVNVLLNNSFGFGGHNACILFGKPQ